MLAWLYFPTTFARFFFSQLRFIQIRQSFSLTFWAPTFQSFKIVLVMPSFHWTKFGETPFLAVIFFLDGFRSLKSCCLEKRDMILILSCSNDQDSKETGWCFSCPVGFFSKRIKIGVDKKEEFCLSSSPKQRKS